MFVLINGYEIYNTKTEELFVPSNIGLSSKTFNWDDMNETQRQRIFEDCIWEGNEGFNTYVLKPPALLATKKKTFEQKPAFRRWQRHGIRQCTVRKHAFRVAKEMAKL